MNMNTYSSSAYLAGSCHFPHTFRLISREDAEFQWELNRSELRARLASLPSSSFARTMFEEDDLFYATFPDARRAAIDHWAAENPLHRSYVAPTPQVARTLESPTAALPHSHQALAPVNHAAPDIPHPYNLEAHPSSLKLNCTYDAVDHRSNARLEDRETVVEGGRSRAKPDADCIGNGLTTLKPSPPPSPEIIRISPHLLVPSQRLPSPKPVVDPASSSPFVPPQFTGDWEADAIAAEKVLIALRPSQEPRPVVPSMNPQGVSLARPQSPGPGLVHRKSAVARSRSHPYPPRTSRSPSGSRASPPRRRKPATVARNEDGKPIMACLFCRGRKIACGPPPPGSGSTTCNQCERRHLKCKYPTENRRGMRKKPAAADAKKKNDRATALDTKKEDGCMSADAKKTSRCGAKVASVKAELSEPEDVVMSDSDDDSSSDWDGDD
ncbi:putative GAL4-like Zn(II)2Cys6 (or C6 zinc) binuclear cluster DNA-binding domain [Lyophyllum shimeji]|uniref:GAL4-like Zn(II)2Cys6 (Or C6 zinc) binuclear cluster DNA-binding domain n=1 Tax=Lyophyllum shimeji TaxID=47721 RepID=A0A9P3PM62_LYOSH|nr:putative GAL4-like Zn(II)2Cys6 (or C6 zinc) binuclear cluster DNA-binding domain [Lyophyllum shimeji]